MVDATVAKASTCRECQVLVTRWYDRIEVSPRTHAGWGCRRHMWPHATCRATVLRILRNSTRAPPRSHPPSISTETTRTPRTKPTSPKKSHQSSTPHTHTHTDTHTRTPLHYISHPTCLYIPYFELATSRQPDEQSPPTGPRTHFATHSVGAPP